MRAPRRSRRTVATLVAVGLLLTAGCSDRGGGSGDEDTPSQSVPGVPASADFGDLKQVCQPGSASGSPAQGVTAKEIQVGVLSDADFTKVPELNDAARVFTSWCNDAGGINGRKLKPVIRDARMLEVRQRVIEACKEDFALVGGGVGLDALGVKDRLSCLLPEFPAVTAQAENQGSDLQVAIQAASPKHWPYEGFYTWLTKEAYPASAQSVGIISGDSPVTKVMRDKVVENLRAVGANASYDELYPATGVSDWTPYAQSIKSKNVKALIFLGDFRSLAKLEQILTSMQHKLDWIDTNSSAYGQEFLDLAGDSTLAYQNNVTDLGGFQPLETASTNPATRQMLDLYKKYAPDAKVTFPAIKAFSSWLLFAKAAASCGDQVTRKCVYDAARKETNWTGGGLQAPIDLSVSGGTPVKCFAVVQADPDGWKPADFGADTGAYRCNAPATPLTGNYPQPATLAGVGKSMDDFH